MRTYCISHEKDVDGLGAAALVVAATGAEFALTDYGSLLDEVSKVPKGVDRFVLCDLGTDDSTRSQFVKALGNLASRCKVVYIDHHYMESASKTALRKAGVTLVHDAGECASMLAFKTFRKELPQAAVKIALFGAVTDYMDNSPMSTKLMEQTDRQFVLAESTLLAEALARKGDDKRFARRVVMELSKMALPHEIEEVPALAIEQLREVVKLAEQVRKSGVVMKRLAYMDTTEHATGNVAKLLIEAFGVPVGVSMRQKEKGWYEVSLRATSECKVHLGRTIGPIAASVGGSGGGHAKAAGCRIPTTAARTVLAALDKVV